MFLFLLFVPFHFRVINLAFHYQRLNQGTTKRGHLATCLLSVSVTKIHWVAFFFFFFLSQLRKPHETFLMHNVGQ